MSLDGHTQTPAAGNRTGCGGGWRSLTGLQALGQVFQLVEDLGKSRELVALEGFVEFLSTRGGIIDAVDVDVPVAVEVVVLEQQVSAWDTAYVAEVGVISSRNSSSS